MTQPPTLGISVSDTAVLSETLGRAAGIRLDVGCGRNKQPGWIGIDFQPLEGVDIVWDLTKFPWPLESSSVLVAQASHVLEHIPPEAPDPRLVGLIKLLLDKGIISRGELAEYIGEPNPGPLFVRFMDEMWRVMKPGGEFAIVVPHGWSSGYVQDPTHVNPCNENTWVYFVKEHPFYQFYSPKPWKIKLLTWDYTASIEVVLVKDEL